MKEVKTFSGDETIQVGKAFGSLLNRGDVVCITGDLGAGKTAFTNGIARALGVQEFITSPTFTIVNEYETQIPLYHFDVYRISDPEEMYDIGFEEYLYGDGIVVIEWADLIDDILPADRILVNINKDMDSGMDARVIHIHFKGERYKSYLDSFKV